MRFAVALLLLGCSGAGQTAWCVRWLSCWQVLPSERRGANEPSVYGPDGECWKSSTAVAKQCDVACKNNVVAQAAMQGAPLECQ